MHSKAVLKIVDKTSDHLCSKAEDTTKMNAPLSEAVEEHSPILASAHDNGSICLWSYQVVI